jgi:hypothetical protein
MASASFHLQKGPDITTITGATIACREGLERCMTIESLKRQGWAENRLADFNVWDSGLGACSNRRASLEDRLALKPQVRTAVLNLLVLYKHSIDICIDLGKVFASTCVLALNSADLSQDYYTMSVGTPTLVVNCPTTQVWMIQIIYQQA